MVAAETKADKSSKPSRPTRIRRSAELDISRMTSKGQITITARLRHALGLKPGDEVLMISTPDKGIKLKRLPSWEEFMASLPLATVEPIDWKAAREEMTEEIAEKVFRQIAEANERR